MGGLMGSVSKALLLLLVVSLVGTTLIWQHQQLQTEQEKNGMLLQQKTERDTLIHQLQQIEADNQKRLIQLGTENRRIAHTLAQREAYLEQLHHHDPHIQSWADTPLPDAIIRLRNRPATTGTGDYSSDLPTH